MSEDQHLQPESEEEPTPLVSITEVGHSAAEAFRSSHATQVLTILMTDLEARRSSKANWGTFVRGRSAIGTACDE